MNARLTAVVVLALLVFVSAIGNVYVKHMRRTLVVELNQLESHRDAIQVEWGQLQLEQSTWATHDRIIDLARNRLGMVMPARNNFVLVTP